MNKKVNPNLIKLAEQTHNPNLKIDETMFEMQVEEIEQTTAPDLKGYIYVPSIKLYVAKERSLNGLSWNQATDKIYNQGINVARQRAEMPTPFEFMSFVKYLLSGNINGLTESERQKIINDILKKFNVNLTQG